MIEFPHKIPVSDLGDENPMYWDYVSVKGSAVRSVLGGFERGERAWSERLQTARTAAEDDSKRRLYDRLVAYNVSLGVRSELTKKLELARDGDARFVVTGQQPGALGGPLLTLHKIATAIALANRLEETHKVPCIPLYWMGADDVDFLEIRELFLLAADMSPLIAEIEAAAHTAATPIGDIPRSAIESVWASVEPFVDAFSCGAEIKQIVGSAVASACDHGEVCARLVTGLTAGKIAVVDGRERSVKERAQDLYCDYFDNEDEVKAEIAAQGKRLEASGYHAQLSLGSDSGVFVLEGGQRRKITAADRAEARRRMAGAIGDFSPGVVLRNLVQDFVFEPVAVVLGPAEIAYRAQMAGVCKMFSVRPPVVFPRMTATYLPPSLSALVKSRDARDVVALLAWPSSFVRSLYQKGVDREIESEANRFRESFRRSSEKFLESARGKLESPTLSKLSKRLTEVERRLDHALASTGDTGKTAALARWPFLANVDEIVRRKNKPQDRSLSLLTPFLFGGEAAAGAIAAAANEYVAETMDGRAFHLVYST